MDIFEMAKKMEKEGEKHYRDLAEQTENEGLKSILTLLANDEVKHYLTFQKMESQLEDDLTETMILQDAQEIFESMKKQRTQFNDRIEQEDMYKYAVEHEKKSAASYLKLLEQTKDPKQKIILAKIIAEEKKHAFLLETIIDFIQRPKIWLEDAEFTKLEEY